MRSTFAELKDPRKEPFIVLILIIELIHKAGKLGGIDPRIDCMTNLAGSVA
jgi:hypothetical protein